jgi:hypothetical protein
MKTSIVFGLFLFGLSSLVACGGEDVSESDGERPVPSRPNSPGVPRTPESTPPEPKSVSLVETCDALDDDLDGNVDQDGVCAHACGAEAVALAAATLRLPRAGDHTVAADSTIEPQLLAYSKIPAFCSAPTVSSDPDEMTIGCGETVTIPGGGILKKALRIAPGGVLRLTAEAILDVTDILVCPGGVIQAGGAPSRDGDGQPGNNLTVAGDQLVLLGKISTSGGFTLEQDKDGGKGGVLSVHVKRLLLAGELETFSNPPSGARRGEGGMVNLIADDESFFSGTIRSGNAYAKMPVCCAE